MKISDKAAAEAKKAAEKNWQMVLAYKRLFGSEDGKAVLEDMERQFGYHASTVANYNAHATYHKEGMKEPLRHIHYMLDRKNKDEEPKPTEAING